MNRAKIVFLAAQAVLITGLMVTLVIAVPETSRPAPLGPEMIIVENPDMIVLETAQAYSPAELEDIRTTLLTVGALYYDIGVRAPDPDLQQLANEVMDAADRLSVRDLALLAPSRDSQGRLLAAAEELHLEIANIVDETKGDEDTASGPPPTAGLPDAPYSNLCGEARPSTGLVYGALLARTAAEGAQLGAQGACNQVVVALCNGGNAALACTVLDILVGVTRAFEDGLTFCTNDIDSAEIRGTLERTEHIHADVEILDGKLDMIIDQLERLRVLSCATIRLLNTPEGLRYEDCPTCFDQPLFPYEFPERDIRAIEEDL